MKRLFKRVSMRIPLCVSALLLGLPITGSADTLSQRNDYATVSAEQFFSTPTSSDSLTGDPQFQDLWIYASLPGFRIAKKSVFSAVEIELMRRAVSFAGEPLNPRSNLLQRYGIFAGITLLDRPNQKGALMVGPGVATDFGQADARVAYLHLIYDHRFILSKDLTIGLGIVFQYHFDAWRMPVNLLPTVQWRITPWTQLGIAWDNLEVRQSLFARTVAVGEVRYDLSFFRSRDELSYEQETVAAGGGLDVRLFGNYSLRVRYKELLYRKEIIRQHGDAVVDLNAPGGRSLRVVLTNSR